MPHTMVHVAHGDTTGVQRVQRSWTHVASDILLSFTDIDTPGEQQKYVIALILWLFAMLPQEATFALSLIAVLTSMTSFLTP